MMKEIVLVQKAVSKVFGDFVSKVVNDGVDVLKSAIKDADLDRKSYNQNLQTRLYQLIVDALNRFTYNKYEKQDKLYDAAESIIKGYIRTQDNVDAVKLGLKMLVSDVNSDTCQEFSETLCGEICSDDNSDLYKEIDMLWKRRESEHFRGELAKIGQNDREILEQFNDLKEVLDFIKGNMNRQEGDKTKHNGVPIVNRADEYAKKWDKNVFLNDFNKRDKNAGVNIKLKELYLEEQLPHYTWKADDEPLDDLKDLLKEYIVDRDKKKMLLILGQPGIGKSTLITWIMANLVEKKDDIFVYQFANDLKNINWQHDSILDGIFAVIGLGYNELEGKTLVLDGFDEICVKGDRERIIHKMNQELEKKNYLKNFSLILTCRENYVDRVELKGIEYITLQAWDDKQIRSFCEKFDEVITRKDSESIVNANLEMRISKIIEKKDILGIPLILYIVLALNVDIERSVSTVDIYDQIFSLKKGSIYDRGYDIEHRINVPEIKRHIHHISQRIAFWMFENNADEATISQEKFEEICEDEMEELGQKGEGIQRDTLIGNFFKINHCDGKGTDELQFVHRSIYEYFVVTYFYESLYKLKAKEEAAGKLGEILKSGELSRQILIYIKYKFDSLKRHDLFEIIKEVFNIMLKNGMIYHTKLQCENTIEREMNIFVNMLEIMYFWNSDMGKLDDRINIYLRYNHQKKLNLRGVELGEADLTGVYLAKANLSKAKLIRADLAGANLMEAIVFYADLEGANLKEVNLVRTDLTGTRLVGANMIGANMIGANMTGADLAGANLTSTDLTGANMTEANITGANMTGANMAGANMTGANLTSTDLTGANLSDANLKYTLFDVVQVEMLHLKYNLFESRVFIVETKEFISYKEYYRRKGKKGI